MIDSVTQLTSGGRRNVLAFVKYARMGASSRVRFWNLQPLLEAQGWNIQIVPLLSEQVLRDFYRRRQHLLGVVARAFLKRLQVAREKKPVDIFWVEKEVGYGLPDIFDRLLLRGIERAVIDYDDGVFLRYNDNNRTILGRAAKFRRYARDAGYITVGSDFLLEEMRRRGATRVRKISSSVITSRYPQREHKERAEVTIGWIGTPVTVNYLDKLKTVFPLVAARARIKVKVIGAEWRCPGVKVECLPWSEEAEAEAVGKFDIGVMPLENGPWERAKCAYKLIQYMASGAVPVGEDVGENAVVLENGKSGFLAATQEEWVEHLLRLCHDHELRRSIGEHARQRAMAQFDVSASGHAVHEVFLDVLRQRAAVKRT